MSRWIQTRHHCTKPLIRTQHILSGSHIKNVTCDLRGVFGVSMNTLELGGSNRATQQHSQEIVKLVTVKVMSGIVSLYFTWLSFM